MTDIRDKEEKLSSFQKPNFDARIAYIDVLKNHLNTVGQLQLRGDYTNLLISLRAMFIYSSPFCKNKVKVQEALFKLRRFYTLIRINNQNELMARFDDELDKFQLLLMDNIKYILMPLRGDEKNEWSDFASQSDIQVNNKNREI